jgi:hypothetical protein
MKTNLTKISQNGEHLVTLYWARPAVRTCTITFMHLLLVRQGRQSYWRPSMLSSPLPLHMRQSHGALLPTNSVNIIGAFVYHKGINVDGVLL